MIARASASLAFAIVIGCGAPSTSMDTGTDAPSPTDAGVDALVPDAMSIDAASDVAVVDAGSDVSTDAASDTGAAPLVDADISDGGTYDGAAVAFMPLWHPSGTNILGDEITWGPHISRILVPSCSALTIYDPVTQGVEVIEGFGGDRDGGAPCSGFAPGATSASDGIGVVYVIDRGPPSLSVIDVGSQTVLNAVRVAGPPDIVRYVAATQEVWVSEPALGQIEIFSTGSGGALAHVAVIATPNGCESLAVDEAGGRVFTDSGASVLGFDVHTRANIATWPNTCATGHEHGVAYDPRGFLVVACNEGHLTTFDTTSGAMIMQLAVPVGMDLLDLDETRHHIYAASTQALFAIVGLDSHGAMSTLGTYPSPQAGHAAASDRMGHAYILDVLNARVMILADPFPATP